MKFIKKIINIIKQLFKRKGLNANKVYELQAPKDNVGIIENVEKKQDETNLGEDKQKSGFFELYNGFKSGKVNGKNLLITDLLDIGSMMMEELDILKEELKKAKNNIEEQDAKIEKLKEKEQDLTSKISKLNNSDK